MDVGQGLEDELIPASALINGVSIVQAEAVEQVAYIHPELETHDVILAEGAESESFVDDDSRGMFPNGNEYHGLYPDSPRLPACYCAPPQEDGEVAAAVRRRIMAPTAPAPQPTHILRLHEEAAAGTAALAGPAFIRRADGPQAVIAGLRAALRRQIGGLAEAG
jgi:hypothetical protein